MNSRAVSLFKVLVVVQVSCDIDVKGCCRYAALLHVPQRPSPQRTLDAVPDVKASRVAYNVYKEGVWHILVTEHGSLEMCATFKGEILWDMRCD